MSLDSLSPPSAPLSPKETGVPLTTVKMRLHRARHMLQTAMAAGCSFGCDERGVMVCELKDGRHD